MWLLPMIVITTRYLFQLKLLTTCRWQRLQQNRAICFGVRYVLLAKQRIVLTRSDVRGSNASYFGKCFVLVLCDASNNILCLMRLADVLIKLPSLLLSNATLSPIFSTCRKRRRYIHIEEILLNKTRH